MKKDIFNKHFAKPERARFFTIIVVNTFGAVLCCFAVVGFFTNRLIADDCVKMFFAGVGVWVSTSITMHIWDDDGRLPHDWSFKDYLHGYKADEQDEDEDD